MCQTFPCCAACSPDALCVQRLSGRLRCGPLLSGSVEGRSGKALQLRRPGHLDTDRRDADRRGVRGAGRRLSLHLRTVTRPSQMSSSIESHVLPMETLHGVWNVCNMHLNSCVCVRVRVRVCMRGLLIKTPSGWWWWFSPVFGYMSLSVYIYIPHRFSKMRHHRWTYEDKVRLLFGLVMLNH